ncbi:MAG: 50S ribosomal protein L11 methyltransferase [Armatimonadetes bacterium]|nr:50S ribosomal protein L11 methyltransferase [Armatimonadota bacterium]
MTAGQPEYTEISILTHPEATEGVIDVLLELGAKGVAEERRPLNVRLVAYLPSDDELDSRVRQVRERLSALERQGLRIGPGTVGLRKLEEQAWSEAWKDQFQILHVTPGLTIVPSWDTYEPQEGEYVVTLDPGAAFGTGGHATTRLCLQGLVQHLRPGDRVADVGCGSGILAITAAALGAREVVATDNDTSVLSVGATNARRNLVAQQIEFRDADLLAGVPGRFDLIVCNIVADEIIRLAGGLPQLLNKGARCITSGFVAASISMVEDALNAAGLVTVDTPSEEGWAACIAMKPERGR